MTDADILAEMKQAFRRFARTVAVISSRDGDRRYAMSVTAVTEVCLEPPSLLVCVNKGASIHGPLSRGGAFCVNLLGASQREVASSCGGEAKGEERFSVGAWTSSDDGIPYLEDAQANFICRNDRAIECGSHTIFIGQIARVHTSGDIDPLMYVNGAYRAGATEPERDMKRGSLPREF